MGRIRLGLLPLSALVCPSPHRERAPNGAGAKAKPLHSVRRHRAQRAVLRLAAAGQTGRSADNAAAAGRRRWARCRRSKIKNKNKIKGRKGREKANREPATPTAVRKIQVGTLVKYKGKKRIVKSKVIEIKKLNCFDNLIFIVGQRQRKARALRAADILEIL